MKPHRLTEPYIPTAADLAWAKSRGIPPLVLEVQTEKFSNHWLDRKTMRPGWQRSWRAWLTEYGVGGRYYDKRSALVDANGKTVWDRKAEREEMYLEGQKHPSLGLRPGESPDKYDNLW